MNDNITNQSLGTKRSIIEQDVELMGDISFSQDILVRGRITGNVLAPLDSDGKVMVQEGGVITGEVRAPYVIVTGKIIGNIFATKRLSIASSAQIEGDIHYGSLEMEQGASINGLLVAMGKQ
ncbi:MAG: Unknown protein [uncultured Thiotrichaceae bacterium]|uniref:Cell shape determination protein CcmA n=1 Tax=uncultured Thiotrichaceae bacterium TaxID=298394 RepID=A0A6S6SLU5_9GAMM|nr:MAG: Unknown protein [uncultured Thiotrichaceae bacterium]